MIISLDWDNISYEKALERCNKISKSKIVDFIDLFRSPMNGGYHCIVTVFDEKILEGFALIFRKDFHDDPKRLKNDEKRGFNSVLFTYKRLGNRIYKRKFLKRFS